MKHSIWIPAALGAAILAACGGGGDSSDASAGGPAAALSISGVAATGAAIAGGAVEAKCSSGTGNATSNADGSYTLSVTSGNLPCMLKITPIAGAALYSVATGTGLSATANINPVTQLVVASLGGTDPVAYFAAFDSTAAAAVSVAKITEAVGSVKATLVAAGVDLGTIDVLAGPLTAANAGTSGNAYDQALDALASKLAGSGTTLADLTTTVAATSTTATANTVTVTTASGTPSLPADLLLKSAAANCTALRSGTYRVVHPQAGGNLANQHGKISIDAATLAIVNDDGSPGTWVANGACRYLDDNGLTDIVVSQAGVIVARSIDTATSTFKIVLGFSEQAHTLAELEGSWNTIGMQHAATGSTYYGSAVTGTITATGTLSAASVCENASTWSVATCVAKTSAFPTWRAAADGGFDVVDPDGTVNGRTFAYRAGGGELMMVHVDADGSFEVRTRKRASELPAIGRVNTSWDVFAYANNQLLATPPMSQSTNTVTAIDAASGSFTRLAKTVGGTDERSETVLVNSPRDGYNFRAAATAIAADGSTVNLPEWTNLGLRGMGLNAQTRAGQKRFLFSVQQPS